MGFYDVLEVLFERTSIYQAGTALICVFLIYCIVFRRRFSSALDPLVYILALSAVSVTFLAFLTINGLVSPAKFTFVIATLALFYLGFLMLDSRSPADCRKTRVLRPQPRVPGVTLAIIFLANFLVLAITYVFFGIPLFLESRLEQFTDSGGFGVLNRLATGAEFGSLVLALIALKQTGPSRKWAVALVIQFVVSALLSGSKGSMLFGLFAWYLSNVFETGTWSVAIKLPRSMIVAICLVFASPFFVIAVQTSGSAGGLADVATRLATRIVGEGDGYAYFLANDRIDAVAKHDLIAPLRQILVAIRILPREGAYNPGIEIIREVLADDSVSLGPNSRLPIYILFFYGYAGIIFAPLLGMALGWARNQVPRSRERGPIIFALTATVYLQCCRIEVDPQLTVDGLFDLGLTLPIFVVATALGKLRRPNSRALGSADQVSAAT